MSLLFSNENSIFECQPCNYTCKKRHHFIQHCSTAKHLKASQQQQQQQQHECEQCGKQYKDRSGYWRHKRKCGDETPSYAKIIQQLIVDNQELRNFIVEQSVEHKKDTAELLIKVADTVKPNNIINNHQSFNINVFLNEQCKDALNFAQFINGFEISHEDLMNTGRLGFVEGVSKIILDNLKQLSITKRPIHCTDAKRETIYIKDDDKWSREETTEKLCKAIQEVTRRSTGTLLQWKRTNPDYIDGDSEFSIQCIAMQRNSQAGYERDTLYPKVVKAIVKEILVDKSCV